MDQVIPSSDPDELECDSARSTPKTYWERAAKRRKVLASSDAGWVEAMRMVEEVEKEVVVVDEGLEESQGGARASPDPLDLIGSSSLGGQRPNKPRPAVPRAATTRAPTSPYEPAQASRRSGGIVDEEHVAASQLELPPVAPVVEINSSLSTPVPGPSGSPLEEASPSSPKEPTPTGKSFVCFSLGSADALYRSHPVKAGISQPFPPLSTPSRPSHHPRHRHRLPNA